jgi:FkbM family methyltransferase
MINLNPDYDVWKLPEGDIFYKRFQDSGKLYSYTEGSWNIAKKYLTNKRVAIDVGAHIGTFTIRYANNFEKVIAFEPVFNKELSYNVDKFDKNKNIHIENFALSDKVGKVNMHFKIINSGRSQVGTISCKELNEQWKTVVSNSIPLDEFQYTNVDFIKIDVENYNMPVLLGAKETIKREKPLIQIELYKSFDQSPISFLSKLGYVLVDSYDVDKFFKHESSK